MTTVDPDHPIASELDRLAYLVDDLLRRVAVLEQEMIDLTRPWDSVR
jgi:hypothetical protein